MDENSKNDSTNEDYGKYGLNVLMKIGITRMPKFLSIIASVFIFVLGTSTILIKYNQQNTSAMAIFIIVITVVGVLITLILGILVSKLLSMIFVGFAKDFNLIADGETMSNDNSFNYNDPVSKLIHASSRINQKIDKEITEIKSISSGDLRTKVELISDRDQMGMALKEMVTNLNSLIVSIAASAEQVSLRADQFSISSTTMSNGATEQASALQQLTASVEEITNRAKLSAQNAEQANRLARDVQHNAMDGNKKMLDMLNAMEAISQSSKSIVNITKVIDDIAFQTNILALNASVEAARAGEHGKSFAVVANEVRSLAARSANAVIETTEMLEGALQRVEIGTTIANETAEALEQISQKVEKVTKLFSEISNSSQQQASAVSEINQGISQISQVVQTNAANSEESASASEELATEANKLKCEVSVFTIIN